MENSPRFPARNRSTRVLSALLLGVLVSITPANPAAAADSRAGARIDIVVAGGGIVDPRVDAALSVIVRADETGSLNAGDVELVLTEEPFTSEEQIRRFIEGESEPVASLVGFIRSPDVPQLESREIPFVLGSDLWTSRLGLPASDDPDAEFFTSSGIFGLETRYVNQSNVDPDLRSLTGRQVIIVTPGGDVTSPAAIAPIITLTTSASGGRPLGPEELQALTIPGGALSAVTSAVDRYPATLAIDGRITASITALGDLAPSEALTWASTLGQVGLAQFGLPWADADPVGSLEIDTLVYARLGEYPWLHGDSVSLEQLTLLTNRSASSVLVSSASLPSDRAVITIGETRVIRVDSLLSDLARDALQAPTVLEAEADLQRAQGIIAYRALTANPEVLVFSVGRLPATAIAPRLEVVLGRFAQMPVAQSVAVPLEGQPSETLQSIPVVLTPPETLAFYREIRDLWVGDVDFATIANDPEGAVAGRWTRYQSLLSSTWLTDPNGLATEWERAQRESAEFRNSVRVEQGSAITVLSDETSLPITIVNDLPSDVVVTLQVRPTTGILAVEEPLTVVTIGAQDSARVFVPVQSLANGTVPVELSLIGAQGEPVGQSVVVPITIRAGWEGVISVGLAVLVGGIFTFGLVRAIQRRRNERAHQEETS